MAIVIELLHKITALMDFAGKPEINTFYLTDKSFKELQDGIYQATDQSYKYADDNSINREDVYTVCMDGYTINFINNHK